MLSAFISSQSPLAHLLARNMQNSVRAHSYPPSTRTSNLNVDGRRPVYLWCLPVMIVGSLGVAMARTVPQLMFWRFIQGIGNSPNLSVGAGVIGDIYKLEERGAALGTYLGVSPILVLFTKSPLQLILDRSSRVCSSTYNRRYFPPVLIELNC